MADTSKTSSKKGGGQISQDLPELSVHVTGHDSESGKAVIRETRPAQWQSYDDQLMAFHVVYTTSQFPASLNDEKDIAQHEKLMASQKLGLVNPNGTVCRIVDFAPGFDCMMHRTQSLDFGVVLEGKVELLLDSGEVQVMTRGDVAVQRATMHAWRNPEKTQWARMLFVLQDSEKLEVGGKVMNEDLGRGVDGLPASGNDS